MAISQVTTLTNNARNGANITISCDTLRTNGAQNGDLLLVMAGTYSRAAGNALATTDGAGSFTEIVNQLSTNYRFRVAYKLLASDDTTITFAGSGNTSDAIAGVASIWRGFASAVLDQTTAVTTGSSTNPNPPSIVTQTANAVVVACAGSMVADSTPGDIANYGTSVFAYNTQSETNGSTVALGYRTIASAGTEDPGTFGSWSTGTWVGVSIALKAQVITDITATSLASAVASLGTPAYTTSNFAFTTAGIASAVASFGTPAYTGTAYFAATSLASAAAVFEAPAYTGIASFTAVDLASVAASFGTPALSSGGGVDLWVVDALDFGMNAFTLANKIILCSDLPSSYANAITLKIAEKDFGIGGALLSGPEAATPNGRKVTLNAITDGVVNVNGTPEVWAVIDDANTRLLSYGPMTGAAPITTNDGFTLDAFTITVPTEMAAQ